MRKNTYNMAAEILEIYKLYALGRLPPSWQTLCIPSTVPGLAEVGARPRECSTKTCRRLARMYNEDWQECTTKISENVQRRLARMYNED